MTFRDINLFVVVVGTTTGELGSGSAVYNFLVGTEQTPSGATPTLGKNSFGDILGGVQLKLESHLASYTAIHWTWNPAIGLLTPHWVTKSGSTIPVFIVLIDASDSASVTANRRLRRDFNNAGTNVTFGIVVSGI
ncbi:hypothetical protein DFH08DRAFT_951335 [Mycena albidolilacea]|uniref:Uncharacterized protein n=1 Tax=Mycena albidolilacea TaxID=1033008 RepID=A0AAD7AJ67_9AGAR|nr:hypothetical protein DFH08DRAFT_951335 [Mycena albidolilacea]